jgi:peptide/nickel transport system substrate-binding protein
MDDAGLNPHDAYSGWSAVRYGVGETLFKFSDEMEPEPWLATGYEFLDDTHCKITLRDDVTFTSGRALDGQAVKECLDDLIAVHTRAASDLKISEITADGNTVTIETSEPCPALINYLCDPYGAIIDMEAGVTEDNNVSGTGPYVATAVSDTEISLVKNENYWDGEPNLDSVVVRSITDGDTLTSALQSGEIDAAYGMPYASYELFSDENEYTVESCSTSRSFFGQANYTSSIMQDDAVRKALAMGIDKDGFIETLLNGRGVAAVGPFTADLTFGDNTVTAESYDPEQAKQILEDAGWVDTDGDGVREKDGQKLTIRWLTYPGRMELPLLAESAQATLGEIGFDIEVNSTANHTQIRKDLTAWDVYVSALVTAPTGDPEYFFSATCVTGASANYGQYSNSKLDSLYEELHTTFDTDKRASLATEMQQLILDDNSYFFASHLTMGIVAKAGVTGIEPHPCDYYEITADLDVA